MDLGNNILVLRKKIGLSQNDLGKLVGTSGDIIGRYERNEVKPSIEVAIKIADALQVSVDYLVGKTSLEIDKKTLQRIEEINSLSSSAKEQVYMVVDALIRDFKTKKAYSS
jgi:transcriptional regulator with XRE-family HTH domain